MERTELNAWLRLTLAPGIGNETARKLLAAYGSAPAVFEQSARTLCKLGSDKLSRMVREEPPTLAVQLQKTLDWLTAGDDRHVVTLGDTDYPPTLLDIQDPPLMLYVLGTQAKQTLERLNHAATHIAIVGSRHPTPQGEANARQFAKALGGAGLCVVSGLAMGIDGAAHDGALLASTPNGGCATVAVVGTGLDRVYPKSHLALAHRIAQRGILISEFPLGTPPLMSNFPRRNRIISGLSRGILVVEAALKSGSLITARLAAEQGKEVFAIPGSIHSPQSRGCHALIKQGAKLVETAQDVLEELHISPTPHHPTPASAAPAESTGNNTDSALLSALGFDATQLDTLQARTGLPTADLQGQLLALELEGRVARLPGGWFQRMAVS